MAEGGSIARNDKSCNVPDLGMGDTSDNSYQPEKRISFTGGPKSMNNQNGQRRVSNKSGATHDRVDSELTNSPIPQRLRNESLSQSNQPPDVESDAVPVTLSPLVNDKAKDKLNDQKASEMHGNGNNTLRLENQIEARLSSNDLFDVVIVFAKADYEIALEYQQWLRSIAAKANINDIKVELYTGINFTDNDVQIVAEVVIKSMRVVMLLSENFTKEECLRFFKEETIGMTRLQICPTDEQMSCFGSADMTTKNIMKTKKDFIRIVHTRPKEKRSYTTPVGLTALNPFEFFNDNPDQLFEDDMAKQFLQKTRSDRNEFQRHQPIMESFSRMEISSMPSASACSSNVTMGKKSTTIYGNQNITNIYNQVTPGEKKSEDVNNEHGKGLQNRTIFTLPTKPSKEEVSPSETQRDIEEDASNLSIPQFANQKTAVKDEFLKTEPPLKKPDGSLKQKSHEKDDDEIMSSKVSYAGGEKKSGRLKATPNYEDYADPDANNRRIADYNEYMAGGPSDNPLQEERPNAPRGPDTPIYPFPPPPYTPPVVTTAQSMHYHLHTHYQENSARQDVETDGGNTRRRQESRRDLHADEGPPQRRQGRDRRQTTENREQRSGSAIVYNIQGCGAVVIGDRNTIVGDQHVNSSNNARATRDADSTATENHINEDQFVMQRNSDTESADEEEQLQSFDDSQRDSLDDLSAEPYMDGRPNTNEDIGGEGDDGNVREEENETTNNDSECLTDNEQINQEGIHPSEPTLNSDEDQRDERSNERIQNRLSGESDALEQDRTGQEELKE